MSGTGIPGQPFLPARTPKTSEGHGARKQHWDQGGCRHVSSLGSSGSVSGWEQLRGFVSSVGMGRPCCVQSNRRCLLSSLPPCCLRPPPRRGCLCWRPLPGYPSAGATSCPFPWGVWRHLTSCLEATPGPCRWAQPQLHQAAPVAFPAPCCGGGGSCPQDGGFAASCGQWGTKVAQAELCRSLPCPGHGERDRRQDTGLSQGPQ